MPAYEDTRGLDPRRLAFTDVILEGMARGGGLYAPVELPALPPDWHADWPGKSYAERALGVLELFAVDLPGDILSRAVHHAYGANFDDPAVAPVREVVAPAQGSPGRYILELFHGPTCAFKDMALQLMPVLFSEAVQAKRGAGVDTGEFVILVATSGDTGKAALEGYRDHRFVSIVVFYPKGGVSDLQERQMVAQAGANVAVFGIRGDFDDAQAAVKATFGDEAFAARLAERGVSLSSANSINWGRVLPQIVYYASGYADMVRMGAVAPGEPIDVVVPTGNFGNILAGYYARRMGVPIGRLLCASNENRVLADFLATGVYDIARRGLVRTPSPSMDILVSSNLERLLFACAREAGASRGVAPGAVGAAAGAAAGGAGAAPHDAAAAAVRGWMAGLRTERRFEVDPDTFACIREAFSGDFVTNDESLATIRQVYERHRYLLDPHTAVAWRVADRHAGAAPLLIVATAHWAKFGADVWRALKGAPAASEAPSGMRALDEVVGLAPGQRVPVPLAGLSDKPVRFEEVVDADPASVRAAVESALAGWDAARA